MAAPYAGSCLGKNGRIIFRKLEHCCIHRNVSGSSKSGQQIQQMSQSEASQEIVIPRKKTWNKLAVLQALASTVKRDPTALPYRFQDDAYLTPKTASELRLFTLSLEAGRNAAAYIVNNYPRFFLKDYAEPHVPSLMPKSSEPQLTEVSEAAMVERIHLRQVTAAVDLYDKLLQAGAAVSTENANNLLDLLCYYGDRDPLQEGGSEEKAEDPEFSAEQTEDPKIAGKARKVSGLPVHKWKKNSNAERIFNLMPERNERSYSALIRGMVKYGAPAKAFELYTDMQNKRLVADVHTFNALISAAAEVRQKHNEKWDLIVELLKQMNNQGVCPNLLTFNATLKSLTRCGVMSRTLSLQTLNEMKAQGIEPSLASYYHILLIFYRPLFGSLASSANVNTDLLHEVMDEISLKSFTGRDPDDIHFFCYAMRICCTLKDLGLAYRVHRLLGVEDNWKLLGRPAQENYYYGRFFNVLCMMEQVDVVLQWYRDMVPSLFFPNSFSMRDLLQALDTENRLEMIPEIWKDIKQLGLSNRAELVEEVLALMARDKHPPEVQQSFADCALAVKCVYSHGDHGRATLDWTASALGNITSILLQAGRSKEAWEMLQLFKANNRVPSHKLLDDFVSSAKSSGNAQQAVELVQLSSSFSLPSTASLSQRVEEEFELSDDQRNSLKEMETPGDVVKH